MGRMLNLCGRMVGDNCPPFIIAEIGINHEGNFEKAKKMVDDVHKSGAECVKFQCHIVEEEMIKNDVVPGNANESIWKIIERCSLSEDEEIELKKYTEELGLIYLNTPFSRAAANRLERMGVQAYKIGSGECNNYPLIEHIASFGKPIILSTGMNDFESIGKAVTIFENTGIDYALLHTTSMYPTPYDKIRLGVISEFKNKFPRAVVGLSDHSIGNYTCFAAIALGASILEKHFTSNKKWPGPDIPVSIDPQGLKELIIGSNAIYQALGKEKTILEGELPTIKFAYSCVVAIRDIKKGEMFSENNIWTKRPNTGQIKAQHYHDIIGMRASTNIKKDSQLRWDMIEN